MWKPLALVVLTKCNVGGSGDEAIVAPTTMLLFCTYDGIHSGTQEEKRHTCN